MPNSPTTCPVCNRPLCDSRSTCRYVHALADRLAAVEARLPVAAPASACKAWCGKTYQDNGVPPLCMHMVFQVVVGDPLEPIYCTKACLAAGRPRDPAPPPSAEPTFEHLVEKAGPVSSGQLAGSAEPTTVPAPDGDNFDCGPVSPLRKLAMMFAYEWDRRFHGKGTDEQLEDLFMKHAGGVQRCQPATTTRNAIHAEKRFQGTSASQASVPVATTATVHGSTTDAAGAARNSETTVAGSNPTAPVASGASVPDGYRLDEKWMRSNCDYMCIESACRDRAVFELTNEAYDARHDEPGLWATCTRHAVKAGALVPVEPPRAEAAQAAEPALCGSKDPHSPRCCDLPLGHDGAHDDSTLPTGQVERNGKIWGRQQPAEPSAPVGFRVVGRSGRSTECGENTWIRFARYSAGDPMPYDEKPRRYCDAETTDRMWDAGCYDILEPIAEPAAPARRDGDEFPCDGCLGTITNADLVRHGAGKCVPAAPPVAAKLSERERCTKDNCVSYFVEAEERIAALETALDAARRDLARASRRQRAAELERDDFREKRNVLRAQLATRDVRIAGLEASHREDVERAVREERERLGVRIAELKALLCRAITYAREDGMKTPGVTRLARVLEEAGRSVSASSGDPAPKVGG